MALVSDLVAGALRLIGVVAGGDDPAAEDLDVGVSALNEMLNSWNAQHFSVYTIVNHTHTLTAGLGVYTIGDGGMIDVPRPTKIESAGITQSGLRTELGLIPARVWAGIPDKAARAKQPLNLYNDADYPLSALSLWPVPKATCTLDLWVWSEITEPLDASDTLDLPPAYERCVRFSLAVTLAPEFGREASATVMAISQSSKAELFGINASNAAGVEDLPQAQPQA